MSKDPETWQSVLAQLRQACQPECVALLQQLDSALVQGIAERNEEMKEMRTNLRDVLARLDEIEPEADQMS